MATTRQKEAARENIAKARQVQSARAHGAKIPKQSQGLSTSAKDKLPDKEFAFPKERKEPLTDARHVRNAIARFDQVEGVSDAERDKAWKRITTAAKRFNVEITESSWRELFKSSNKAGKTSRASARASSSKSSGPATKTAGARTKASGTTGRGSTTSRTSRSTGTRSKITGTRSRSTGSTGTRSKTSATSSRTSKASKS